MKVAVVGAGFTGLSASYKLAQQNHQVVVFEKNNIAGGLAATFKKKGWSWSLEKHYHHWFTNDIYAISLIKELDLGKKLLYPKSLTSIYYNNKILPFNTPKHVLMFDHLSLFKRVRVGFVVLLLKLIPQKLSYNLEKYTAISWLEKWFGKNAFQILWQPLLKGKFSHFYKFVNMTWFWARIKKRTPVLCYLENGYQALLGSLEKQIIQKGGIIKYQKPFKKECLKDFDKVIITTASNTFAKIFPDLPSNYQKKLTKTDHLAALNLVIISKEKVLDKTYWLNINSGNFPFVAIVQHTNMIDKKYYAGNHIAYIANYLPKNHEYLKMKKEDLFRLYLPYLKKINPKLKLDTYFLELFQNANAQPVFPTNYSKNILDFQTPAENVYLANMDMVYPWDRGTNYAIELGYKVAEYVIKKSKVKNQRSKI